MQDLELFSNLGLASASLFIIYFIVRHFITATNKKDDFIIESTKEFTKQTASFDNTIRNHVSHSTKAINRLSLAVEHLAGKGKEKRKKK